MSLRGATRQSNLPFDEPPSDAPAGDCFVGPTVFPQGRFLDAKRRAKRERKHLLSSKVVTDLENRGQNHAPNGGFRAGKNCQARRFAPNKKEVEGLLRSPPVKEDSFIQGGSARRPVATRNDNGWAMARVGGSMIRALGINRGKDAPYGAPPAQNRTCGIPAYGSYLRCLTAKHCSGQGCRMRGFGRKSSASRFIRP